MSTGSPAPFEACEQVTGRGSSQALVRYKTNDYSVPVSYGHREVRIRGSVDRVAIGCGADVIARHQRSYEREYVQVLRLLETFELSDLHVALKSALRMGAVSLDAIYHLVLCQVDRRPPKLDLDVYPYLPRADVGMTRASSYMCFLAEGAA